MNSHKHARLTPKGRALLVGRVLDEGWTVAAASQAAGVSKRTGFKWLARFKAQGAVGLADRSSRPLRCPRALTMHEQGELEGLRRQRWPLWRIAMQAGRGMTTVSRFMKRLGLSRLKSLEPPVPVVRYERAAAGELLHIDIKKLGRIDGIGHRITGDRTKNHNRGIGWDMVHLAIDDHSRVSFAQVLPSCVQLRPGSNSTRALAWLDLAQGSGERDKPTLMSVCPGRRWRAVRAEQCDRSRWPSPGARQDGMGLRRSLSPLQQVLAAMNPCPRRYQAFTVHARSSVWDPISSVVTSCG
jgi:transposase